MFELVEIVGTTAFFRRTAAETFDPYCDGWYLQPYNTSRFPIDVSTAVADLPTGAEVYRDRLVPLIESWKAAGARVAIFGTGEHTEQLWRVVPELDTLTLVAYLESSREKQSTLYRGRPVRSPHWAEGNCDVVLCSSFANELAQMAVLDCVNVKVVPSHTGAAVGQI